MTVVCPNVANGLTETQAISLRAALAERYPKFVFWTFGRQAELVVRMQMVTSETWRECVAFAAAHIGQ